MGAFDIAVIVLISAAFLAVVGTMVYRKIKHKGGGCSGCGCDCGCKGCSLGCDCNKPEEK